jgi:cyanophycin synthetase
VAERVRDGGTVVLNADDPNLATLPEDPALYAERKTIVFFSLVPDNLVIRRHLGLGGKAYWLSHGWVVEGMGRKVRRLFEAASLPMTFGGAARFQVANVLAAAAAAISLGADAGQVYRSFASFDWEESNPGRMNLYQAGPGHVLLDYGHNPAAFEAIGALTRLWGHRRMSAVVGGPGDRTDEQIRESGRVVARAFSKIIIREDGDLRGGQPGEVAAILLEAIKETNASVECQTVLDERDAVARAVEELRPEETVAVFYEDYDGVKAVLDSFRATPVRGFSFTEDPDGRRRAVGT